MNKQVPHGVFAVAIVAALLAAFWVVGRLSPTTGTNALIGKPGPPIEGKTSSGETFRLSDHKGKVVLVNFWATWCGPCRLEIPDLIAFQKKYGDRGFTVVGLSHDETADPIAPFVKETGINYPVLLAPPDVRQAFGGVPAIPATYLIDKNGVVVSAHVGVTPRETLAQEIEEHL